MMYENWELLATAVGVIGGTAGISGAITKAMLNAAVKSITHHCMMQRDQCMDWRKTSEQDRKDIKDTFGKHSHKALDNNGGKITL